MSREPSTCKALKIKSTDVHTKLLGRNLNIFQRKCTKLFHRSMNILQRKGNMPRPNYNFLHCCITDSIRWMESCELLHAVLITSALLTSYFPTCFLESDQEVWTS